MKKSSFALTLAVFVLANVLAAQSKDSTNQPANASSPASSPADQAWENLKAVAFAPQNPGIATVRDAVTVGASQQRQAATFLSIAGQAKDFYTKNASHGKAIEAKKLESVMLMQAVQSGDTSVEGRMESTVEAFCADKSIPEPHRAEVAGTHGFLGALRRGRGPGELSANTEAVSRSLILSYPTQPQGYESLLTIAAERDAVKGRALATELLSMPAPLAVKQGAQLLVERLDLVGKPLTQILADAGATKIQEKIKSGKPTVIYTWASWSPGSVAFGEMLSKRAITNASVIGLNLDQDTVAAEQLAKEHSLPGLLQYDARGVNGALAKGLKVNGAPLVYFLDAQGVISDVRGLDGLEQKLASNGL